MQHPYCGFGYDDVVDQFENRYKYGQLMVFNGGLPYFQ